MTWAYEFTCERSLSEMEAILVQAGPWHWGIRDCDWYPDFLQCRPHDGVRICLYARKPPEGPEYRCLVEIAPGPGQQRPAIDTILVRLLDRLPATGRVEVEPGEWPFD